MRKVLVALALAVGGVVTAATAQGTGPGATSAGQGDAFVVALWLGWLGAFLALLVGSVRLLSRADASEPGADDGNQSADEWKPAA